LLERGDRFSRLAKEDLNAALAQPFNHRRAAAIGATDLEAPFGQDACEGRHADASDSNEVERLLAIEQQGQVHLRVEPKISWRRHPSFYWLLLFLASLALRLMARRRAEPGLPIGLRGSAEIRSVGSAPETP
jgi:hypothetical protein